MEPSQQIFTGIVAAAAMLVLGFWLAKNSPTVARFVRIGFAVSLGLAWVLYEGAGYFPPEMDARPLWGAFLQNATFVVLGGAFWKIKYQGV